MYDLVFIRKRCRISKKNSRLRKKISTVPLPLLHIMHIACVHFFLNFTCGKAVQINSQSCKIKWISGFSIHVK